MARCGRQVEFMAIAVGTSQPRTGAWTQSTEAANGICSIVSRSNNHGDLNEQGELQC